MLAATFVCGNTPCKHCGTEMASSQPFRYFSHMIDADTLYCVRCGQFLGHLQDSRGWNDAAPACNAAANVVAVSHLARRPVPPGSSWFARSHGRLPRR